MADTTTQTAPVTPAIVPPTFLGDKLDLATEIGKLPEGLRQAITDGHLVADIRTTAQPLRATLTLGGTVKEPQIRN